MEYYMPVRLYTGSGCVASHADVLSAPGHKALLVTGRHSAKACGALDDVTAALSAYGVAFVLFDGITANPLLSDCMKAGRIAAENGCDFIIGIGGGSPLDAAKAVAVFAANSALSEKDFYAKAWASSPLPIVLVGTTAGTGSEVTDVSVLTDSTGKKHSIHVPRLYAAVAFGDEKYTATMAPETAFSTAIDAYAHCAESYFSKKATVISRAYAVAGIRLLLPVLPRLAEGCALTQQERTDAYEASILGGLAISVTGTCFPHNVGYYLTENFGVPHGLACAAFHDDFLTFVAQRVPDVAKGFFEQIDTDEAALRGLFGAVTVNAVLTEAEIEKALPRWADNGTVKNTLGDCTVADIRPMLMKYCK